MKKKLLNILKYSFFLGLGLFLVWLSLYKIQNDPDNPNGWNEFKEALATARYWMIIPVFFILFTSHLVRALRWRLLMEPMGYFPTLPNTFFAVMIGYLANLAVPRLGEVLKCTLIARYEKVPAEKIVGTIVAERAFDVLSLGIVFLLALIFQFDVVVASYQYLKTSIAGNSQEAMSQTKKIILLTITILVIIIFAWLIITKRLQHFIQKLKKILLGVWEGLITARKLKHKVAFIFYSIAIWALYLGGTWLGFYATTGTSELGLKVALSCLAMGSIGMIVTPGGIGTYSSLLAFVLIENKVVSSVANANGLLQWLAQTIIVLLVGFICMGLLPIYNKKKNVI
jgi:uncharacterized protein (TIRG00374 family)